MASLVTFSSFELPCKNELRFKEENALLKKKNIRLLIDRELAGVRVGLEMKRVYKLVDQRNEYLYRLKEKMFENHKLNDELVKKKLKIDKSKRDKQCDK